MSHGKELGSVVTETLSIVVKNAPEATQTVANTISKISNKELEQGHAKAVAKVIENVSSQGAETTKVVAETLANVAKTASEVTQTVANVIADAASHGPDVIKSVAETLTTVSTTLPQLTTDVANLLTATTSHGPDVTIAVAETVTDAVHQTSDNVAKTVVDVISDVSSLGAEVTKAVSETLKNVVNTLPELTESVANVISDVSSQGAEATTISETLTKVVQDAPQLTQSVTQSISLVAQNTPQSLPVITTVMTHLVSPVTPQSTVINNLNQVLSSVSQRADGAQQMEKLLNSIANGDKSKFISDMHDIGHVDEEALSQMVGSIFTDEESDKIKKQKKNAKDREAAIKTGSTDSLINMFDRTDQEAWLKAAKFRRRLQQRNKEEDSNN